MLIGSRSPDLRTAGKKPTQRPTIHIQRSIDMHKDCPKLFISYSWSSPEHQDWVIDLATKLRSDGVDVILDKWDLKDGQDAHAFMEKMVTDPSIEKVALICDRIYCEKADNRRGGVGTETQIVTGEIYSKAEQSKFVALPTENDNQGKPYLPVFMQTRKYIDFTDQDQHGISYENVLRWLFDKPYYPKPELGSPPVLLSEDAPTGLNASALRRRLLSAIKSNRDYYLGATDEYFEAFVTDLERFTIDHNLGNFDKLDDAIINSIDSFMPYRNELIEVFITLARYYNSTEIPHHIHRLFENLIPYMHRPPDSNQYHRDQSDNFKFIVHELFLYAIACFVRHERFDCVAYLLRQGYHFVSRFESSKILHFSRIREYMWSLESRNKRLQLRRLSLRADMLERRSSTSGLTFDELMQADFILFLRADIDNNTSGIIPDRWWPETLLYADRKTGPFKIFAKAESSEYFNKIKAMLNLNKKEDLAQLVLSYNPEGLSVPRWDYISFNPGVLVGIDRLANRP